MDIRCERCRAQYVFDDDQVTSAGLTVQCTNCGHLFRVKKKELVVTLPVKPDDLQGEPLLASAAARPSGTHAVAPRPSSPALPVAPPAPPPEHREWQVRRGDGSIFTVGDLTTLQRWIVEQRVGRDDELSAAGGRWSRLGEIPELASFFQVVDAAARSGAAPSLEVDLSLGDAPPARTRGSSWAVVVAAGLIAVAAAGAAVLVPRLLEKPPPPAPVTVVAAPPAPTPAVEPARPPDPPPAPVVAPLVEEKAPPPPAPAAAKGPKALLARASSLHAKGDAEAALELYGRVASDDPGNVEAQVGRGLCYLDLENWAPAEASFEAALRLEPEHADALLGLAETYRFQGKKAEAVPVYERYLARYPDGDEAQAAKNALAEMRK